MSKLISETRLLICEYLLNLIVTIAPKNKEEMELVDDVLDSVKKKYSKCARCNTQEVYKAPFIPGCGSMLRVPLCKKCYDELNADPNWSLLDTIA